ncbi:hypothetical protein Gogos_022352 [Gossypium gossypioides]|uniref:Uncharacterized protein n=1 Tax=Gossypium gossypioides TaxID=34282 RepID=A0A7J9D0F6_GOSGO|nr:hypothetical protein [Gossypium gossypioides]
MEGDIMRSTVNGIPLMVFSKRVHQLLVKYMATTGLQFLESLYAIQTDGYYLAKFQNNEDFEKEISEMGGKVAKLYFNTDNRAQERRYGHAKEVFPKSVPCSKAYNKVLSSGGKVSSDDSMMVEDDIAEGLKLMDHG